MATLEEIIAEVGEEKAAVIHAAIEAEKTRGIESSRKKGGEVTKWMTEANRLKDTIRELEIDPASDLAPQIATLKAKIDKAAASGDTQSAMERKFQQQIDAINKSLEAERKEKVEAQTRLSHATIKEQLSKAFGDSVIGAEDTIELMILKGNAKLNDAGKPVIVDNDVEVDLTAGVEAFKKANPSRVKNTARAGGGSSGGSGGSQGGKVLTMSQFETMSVKDRAAFFAANPGAQVVN
jgi:hypothetical protein